MGGFGLEFLAPHIAVIDRSGLAPLEGLRSQHVDGQAVLGVHHDQPAVAGRLLHGPQDLAVVRQHHARVGHEQLEAGDALIDQQVHFLESVVVDAAENHVESVVDGTVAFGLGHPGVEALTHVLAGGLHSEIDNGGGTAPRRGPGSCLECVGGEGAAEGQLHVGVHIHPARHHQASGRVDDVGTLLGCDGDVAAGLQNGSDLLTV